jgi:PAS domain S-box-containing protein
LGRIESVSAWLLFAWVAVLLGWEHAAVRVVLRKPLRPRPQGKREASVHRDGPTGAGGGLRSSDGNGARIKVDLSPASVRISVSRIPVLSAITTAVYRPLDRLAKQAVSRTDSWSAVMARPTSSRSRSLIRHRLKEGGLTCDVHLVDSQDRFEAALTQGPFDLIFCDYNLPGYDRIAALTYAQHTRPDIPVLLISGTVGDEEAVRCLQRGATDYLRKDRLQGLVPAVQRAMQEAKARRARRVTEEQLRQSELLNRTLVEHLPHRIFVKDLHFNYLFCNALYARDLGIAASQIVGKEDWAFFPSERAEGFRGSDREVMTHGQIDAREERYTEAGQEHWTQTVRIPYRDAHGAIIGMLGLIEDISDRKRAEQALRRSVTAPSNTSTPPRLKTLGNLETVNEKEMEIGMGIDYPGSGF